MKMHFEIRRVFAQATLILIFVSATIGQQRPATDQQLSEVGNLSGIVVGENGQPLPGASVLIRRLNSVAPPRIVITNNEGKFEVVNLDRALYSVSASVSTYVSTPRDQDTPAPFYRLGDSIRLELIKGGIITGAVTRANNEPVIAVRIRAIMLRDFKDKGVKSFAPVFQGMTDDRGIYRIYGITPGTYIVEAGGPPITSTSYVSPYDLDVPTFGPSSARDTATEINVSSGQETIMDIRYRAERGRSISGTVKKLGAFGANVTLTAPNNSVIPISSSFQGPRNRGFEFLGIADGVYDLVAQETLQVPGSNTRELVMSESRRITVKGMDITGIELVTKPLGSISGQLVLQPSTAAECASKRRPSIAETIVTLQRNRKGTESEPAALLRITSVGISPEKNGDLVWRNLIDAQYGFATKFYARYWYLHSITLPGVSTAKTAASNLKTDAARNWTTIKSGARLSGLTITLAEGAGSLRGKLEVPEGTNVPADLDVYLVPAEKEKAEDVLRYFVAEAIADGSFNADNLPPGRYLLLAQRRAGTDQITTPKLQLPDAAENRLKLRRAAETTKIEIELKPCQNLSDYKLPFTP